MENAPYKSTDICIRRYTYIGDFSALQSRKCSESCRAEHQMFSVTADDPCYVCLRQTTNRQPRRFAIQAKPPPTSGMRPGANPMRGAGGLHPPPAIRAIVVVTRTRFCAPCSGSTRSRFIGRGGGNALSAGRKRGEGFAEDALPWPI